MTDNESENDDLAEQTVAEGGDPSATDALEAALAELESGLAPPNSDEDDEEMDKIREKRNKEMEQLISEKVYEETLSKEKSIF